MIWAAGRQLDHFCSVAEPGDMPVVNLSRTAALTLRFRVSAHG